MSENQTAKKATALPQKETGTHSQRFTAMVVREFGNVAGTLQLSPYQQRLGQHLFLAVDAQLKTLEAKRAQKDKDGLPIVWSNINMEKLAIDAVHRIELGLDALIPNMVHPIPYKNSKTGKYDLDLRVGYVGKDYYRRKMAIDPPMDIIYELVHEKDKFRPIKKTAANPVESYEFEIGDPFDRGKVIGGFGYIMYERPEKNKLILVSKADFDKSKAKAQSNEFWGNHEREMQFKTLVHRVTSKLNVDPEKINASFMAVELDDNAAEIEANANKGAILDIDPTTGEVKEKPKADPERPTLKPDPPGTEPKGEDPKAERPMKQEPQEPEREADGMIDF
jgi:recombination protein RecT